MKYIFGNILNCLSNPHVFIKWRLMPFLFHDKAQLFRKQRPDDFGSFSGDFSVRVETERIFNDQPRFLKGQDVYAVETGVLAEVGGGEQKQDLGLGDFFHQNEVQMVVIPFGRWAELETASLVGKIHGGCKEQPGIGCRCTAVQNEGGLYPGRENELLESDPCVGELSETYTIQKILDARVKRARADRGVKADAAAHEKAPGEIRGDQGAHVDMGDFRWRENASKRLHRIRLQIKAARQIISRASGDVAEGDLLKICKTVQHIVGRSVPAHCHDDGGRLFRAQAMYQAGGAFPVPGKKGMVRNLSLLEDGGYGFPYDSALTGAGFWIHDKVIHGILLRKRRISRLVAVILTFFWMEYNSCVVFLVSL